MSKKLIKRMIICIVVLLAIFILVRVVKIQDKILKGVYPIRYAEYVEKYANENKVDSYMKYNFSFSSI